MAAIVRKIHLYENTDNEFHGLAGMKLEEIFRGIKELGDEPEELWLAMSRQFGPDFFLPTVEKYYGHIFAKKVREHNSDLEKVLELSKKNEEAILVQAQTEMADLQLKV